MFETEMEQRSATFIRDAFKQAKNKYYGKKQKKTKRDAHNTIISFYEQMYRFHWVDGRSSSVDGLLALRLTGTLLRVIEKDGHLNKNDAGEIRKTLIKRATKKLRADLFDRSCEKYCFVLKIFVLS